MPTAWSGDDDAGNPRWQGKRIAVPVITTNLPLPSPDLRPPAAKLREGLGELTDLLTTLPGAAYPSYVRAYAQIQDVLTRLRVVVDQLDGAGT